MYCGVDLFDSVFPFSMLLFHNLANTKYVFRERPVINEEYIKHHKSTVRARCKIIWVKTETTCIVFLNGAPINNY